MSEPIRVLHVGSPPEGHGGISVVIARLSKVQAEDPEIDVQVVPTVTPFIESPRLHKARVGLRALRTLLTSPHVRGSVVHLHLAIRLSFYRKALFASIARHRGAKTLLHLHGSNTREWYATCSPHRQRWIRAQLDAADCIVSVNEGWTDFYRSLTTTRVTFVHNGLDIREYDMERPDRGEGPLRVLYLGRIDDRKGSWHLLEAVAALNADPQQPDVHLVLAGNGEVEEARRRARELGIEDRVELPGWIGTDQVREQLRRADVLVLPSVAAESFGLVLIEAMSARLPVVASRIGGIPEVVEDGQSGLLVPPADSAALAAALAKLAGDPALCRRLGTRGREIVEARFDIHVSADRFKQIYREMLAS